MRKTPQEDRKDRACTKAALSSFTKFFLVQISQVCMGMQETHTEFSSISFLAKATCCPCLTYLVSETAGTGRTLAAGATYQRGLRLGVLP